MTTFFRSLTVSMILLLLAGQALARDSLRTPRTDDQERDESATLEPSIPQRPSERPGPRYAPDEILVTFQEGLTDADCRTSIADAGHTVLRRLHLARNPRSKQNRRYLVRIPSGWSVEEALDAVRQLAGVAEAQPNYIYRALETPDDTYFDLQWGLENTGSDTAHTAYGLPGPDPWVSDTDIDSPAARDIYFTWTAGEVIVAISDTGVDYDHSDLAGITWTNVAEVPGNGADDDGNGYVDDVRGWDYVDDDNDPDDSDGHGTHVAGVIGAITNNGQGVAGIADNVKLMALRVLDASGSGYTSDVVDSILYAIDNGAHVINMSWGGADPDPALESAILDAADAGVLVPCASGNESSDNDVTPHYPSSYTSDNIIGVAASTPWRDLADFSNWGRDSVHIVAPGDEIMSTRPTDGPDGIPERDYQIAEPGPFGHPMSWSGTSMATPYVSGVAAILYGFGDTLWPGAWDTMSPAERMTAVRDRILERASRWPALSGKTVTDGHLDLLSLVEDDIHPPDPVGPSLEAVTTGTSSVTMRWLASGDDGATGRANYYDLRYQQGPTIDFPVATPAEGIWTPGPAGSTETFTATGLQPNTEYTFGLVVVDNVGNQSLLTTLTVVTPPQTVFFWDDMESGLNGWTAGGTWALTTEASNSPTHSWTDSPGEPYGALQDVSLTSPAIPTDGSPLEVAYWQRYDMEDGADFGYLEARSSVAGVWGDWMPVLSVTGTDLAWHDVTAALPVTGEEVQIRFRFETDALVQADGWYVDDVSVRVPVRPPADKVVFEDTFDGNDCSNWQLSGAWGCESDALSDSPGSDYPANNHASAQLIYPLSFEGAQSVEVSFEFVSFDYEQDHDFLFFEYSLDGVNWRRLGRYTGSQSGTQVHAVDELAGMPTVWFRFVSQSDPNWDVGGTEVDYFQGVADELPPGCTSDPDCDDGDVCNGAETCDPGTGLCLSGTPLDCTDGNPCTDDLCDPATGCHNSNVAAGTPCDDDDLCNGSETCDGGGTCQPGTPLDCTDGNPCTDDICDPATGCHNQNVAAGTPCDDTEFCNGSETCDGGGTCQPGTPLTCDDGDTCTVDTCDEVLDVCQNIAPPPPGEVYSLRVDNTLLSWDPEAVATGYDIVQGDLAILVDGGGDFTAATTACLDNDWPGNNLPISDTPAAGDGFWFLVRGMNCTANGSYDTGSPSQVGSRDAGIDASPASCP
jgi:subtilisin family serine protease